MESNLNQNVEKLQNTSHFHISLTIKEKLQRESSFLTPQCLFFYTALSPNPLCVRV